MKWKQAIQHIPDGAPIVGVTAAVRRIGDGSTVMVLKSDAEGYITVQQDGHLEPVYLHLQDAPGGDKVSRSDETHQTGATNPAEWPAALRALGDGVVSGYAGSLDCMVGPISFSVMPGAALVYGHPVVIYTGVPGQLLGRPPSGTYFYRVVIRLYPTGSPVTPGKADLVVLGPSIGSAPALTRTTTVWEMALATITVPQAGDPTCLDERNMLGDAITVAATTKPPTTATATGGAGVDIPGSAVTLSLPEPTPYTITARLFGEQFGATSVWAQTNAFGFGTNPLSMAKTPNGGWIYVADYRNAQVLRFDQFGTYYGAVGGLPYVRGICADDNYVYIAYVRPNTPDRVTIGKYGHDLAGPYTTIATSVYGYPLAMTCTPDYATNAGLYLGATSNIVSRHYKATLGRESAWQISFTDPHGMTYNPFDGYLYIISRYYKVVYKFRAYDFAYAYNFGGFTDPTGLEIDANGWLVVADYGAGLVRRMTITGAAVDTFPQNGCVDVATYPGDVIYVLDYLSSVVRRFDQTVPGYGSLAIDLDGSVTPFLGLGNRNGSFGNVATVTKQGPTTVTVKGKMRADAGTLNLRGVSLSAVATPQE